jgi:hypothetical protein
MPAGQTILYTQPRGGGERLEEFPAEIIQYGFRLNRPGGIEFALNLDHSKTSTANIDPGEHEIGVERNDAVVWVGPALTGDEDDTARTVTIGGEGLLSYLRKMHVTSTLTFTVATHDQFTIARSLIAHHQNKAGGNFGIDTTATTLSGRKRDRVYPGFELKNIFEAVVELSEVDDGFDFNINPATRTFDLYYPKRGQRREDVVFDVRNIRQFQRRRDATVQASQVYAVGAGEGDDMLTATVQSSSAVAQYGLTQTVSSHKSVSVAQTLVDHATEELDTFASVANLLTLTVGVTDPPIFSYGLGDEVRIRWDSPWETVNEYQRLIGFDVIWQQGAEFAQLFLSPL